MSLKRPPFAALRERLGIDPDAPLPELQPEPVTGPRFGACPMGPDEDPCPGTLRVVERDGPLYLIRCDRCDYEGGVPVRKMNPKIAQEHRLEQAELPKRFFGRPFKQDEENRPALEAVRSWIASADGADSKQVSALLPAPALWGEPGRGKSHLLVAMCVRLIRQLDVTVLYRSTRQLLRELQQFEHEADRQRAWKRVVTVDVLALDDLGAQQSTDWKHDQLADLIDERYSKDRPLLVVSNFPPEAWEEMMDARTFSRLRGMTFPVELRGVDRRYDRGREE